MQQAGRDHFIIVTDTGKTVMLLLVYLLWAEFDEPLDYQYKSKISAYALITYFRTVDTKCNDPVTTIF